MITARQKEIIIQVLNVFETGTPAGKYHSITVMADGINRSRQITYGRSQTTEQGNLKTLLEMYVAEGGKYAGELKSYIPAIKVVPLADDMYFRQLLRKSALEDPIMRRTQDSFFDQLYYQPAEQFFLGNGFSLPLSMLVIYDSYIHSGRVPAHLREKFAERVPVNGGAEKAWTAAYVDTRHRWLENHGNLLLRKTIYRTQCFKDQIDNDNWDLSKPLTVIGVKVG